MQPLLPHSGDLIANRTVQNTEDPVGRSVLTVGGGLGYFDSLTVTGAHQVTFADPAALANYAIGSPLFLFRLDGFFDSVGQLNTLTTVVSKSGSNMIVSGAVLDNRLTAGKWFASGQIVGAVAQGTKLLTVTTPIPSGSDVLLTDGAVVANEGRDEWNRVVAQFGNGKILLQHPVFRDYSNAVLAVATPVTGVRFRNTTVLAPSVGVLESMFVKYSINWDSRALTTTGVAAYANCSFHTYKDSTFHNLALNSCHDFVFVNCHFPDCHFEECCFNCRFYNCTFGGSAQPLGSTTQCERLTFINCKIQNSTSQAIGLPVNDLYIDGFTGNNNAGGMYFQGDRMRLTNISSDVPVNIQIGHDVYLQNIKSPSLVLGSDLGETSGIAYNCSNVQVYNGNWTVIND
jgi:hypothetical protein